MKQTIYTLLLILVSTVTLYSQTTIDSSLLTGEWAGKEIVNNTRYEVVIGLKIEKSEATHILQFLTGNTLSFKEANIVTTYTYTIVDTNLVFDNKEYEVLELNTKNLKLQLQQTGSTATKILYFSKVESGGY